ncbi:succinate dehydrogenase cytochrome b558 subunit [Lysinibacillus sp. PLM2]|nr:succinate dehydrogenase cytochrome b558 subunit [Lysinibacillus sp. PLM2]
MSKNHEFYWRRLHSLLGIIPVGLFLLVHFTINFTATQGAEAYNAAAGMMEYVPFLIIVEWVVIYIPLLFHGLYGVYIAFTATNNVKRFGTFHNWMFVLQRFTGIFLVVFIAWHIFQTRIQKALGAEVNYDMMAGIVANPWMLAFYIVGILAATFHLSNGIWSFLVSWGITQSPKSQKVASYITMAFFVVFSIGFVAAILAFV